MSASAKVKAALVFLPTPERLHQIATAGNYVMVNPVHALKIRAALSVALAELERLERELANARDWAERDRPQVERMRR